MTYISHTYRKILELREKQYSSTYLVGLIDALSMTKAELRKAIQFLEDDEDERERK